MARVRQYTTEVDTTEQPSSQAPSDWPFAVAASAEPPKEEKPAKPEPKKETPAPAPASAPVASAAPSAAAKPAPNGMLGLVMVDMRNAAEIAVGCDDATLLPSALDELEMRIKIVRMVLGA